MPGCQVKEKLLGVTTYSQELGLHLLKVEDRFKWFLASVLFAKRISARIAMATFREFENKLQQLKGVGPVAVSIFLRELRSIWPKASPRPSPLSLAVAQKLGVATSDLQLPGLESALVRVHLDFCKKQKCVECPVKEECFQPVSTQ